MNNIAILEMVPPHADVRVICDELWEIEDGFKKMGLVAPCLVEARNMLARISIRLHDLEKTTAENGVPRPGTEAEQRGYRRGVQDAARLAQEHRARVPNHHPDEPMGDLVAQGYGNAALNLECAILALLEQTGEKK